MSLPTGSDGKPGGEDYYAGNNTKPLQTCHQPQTAPALLQWSNHLMGGHHTFLQQHQQHLYNMQAQAAYATAPSAGGQQETYSVLRMGNGNFLKIYHCPENTIGPMSVEAPFTLSANSYNQHQPHLQTTYQHHFPQQPSQQQHTVASTTTGAPQMFNSYELFSSNTLTQLPTPEVTPLLVLGPSANDNNQNSSKNPTQTKVSMTINNGNSVSEATSNANAATMIINNLVSNWSPNLTGGVYTQFGSQANQLQDEIILHSKPQQATLQQSIPLKDENEDKYITATTLNQFEENAEKEPNLEVVTSQTMSMPPQHTDQIFSKDGIATSATPSDLAANSTQANCLLKEETPHAPKKRIVAEVKPMRMTYSDVLSKLNNQQEQKQSTSLQNQSNIQNNRGNQKTNNANANTTSLISNTNNGLSNRRSLDEITLQMRSVKKSPIHENKENVQNTSTQPIVNNKTVVNKRSSVMISNNSNNGNNANNTTSQKQQQTQKIQNNKTGSANTDISTRKRPTNVKRFNDTDLENSYNGGKLLCS